MKRRGAGLFLAVIVVVLLVMGIFAAGTMLIAHYAYGWAWWTVQAPSSPGDPTLLEPMRIALTIAAGLGGAVAIVVAFRRQRMSERQEPRQQYVSAVDQLGATDPTTRLAGVYALAHLADAWPEQRQQCVDVLSARLRLPWDPQLDPAHPLATKTVEIPSSEGSQRKTTYAYPNQAGELEVRETILRVIGEHLRPKGRYGVSRLSLDWRKFFPRVVIRRSGRWSELTFDFTGAELPWVGWSDIILSTPAQFANATFIKGAHFGRATFGQAPSFEGSTFAGGVSFEGAAFMGSGLFDNATFMEYAFFRDTKFGSGAHFDNAEFQMSSCFDRVVFSDSSTFSKAVFSSDAYFNRALFRVLASFVDSTFDQDAMFGFAEFHDANFEGVTFKRNAHFPGASFARKVPPEIQQFVDSRPLSTEVATLAEGEC